RSRPRTVFGIQTWVALPDHAEDTAASFEHHGREALPFIEDEGKEVRLIIGSAWGARAPVKTFTETFYADVVLAAGAKLPLPEDHADRGVYVVEGSILIAGTPFAAGQMMVFRPGDRISLAAGEAAARLMVRGGETMNGPRYISWNFVASSQERIDAAKEAWRKGDWEHGRFRLPPGDEAEFTPLPEQLN